MWKTLMLAADQLGANRGARFTRASIIERARSLDSSHHEMAYGAMFQTMVIEAPTASASPVGKVFNRIEHGLYRMAGTPPVVPPTESHVQTQPAQKARHNTSSTKTDETARRLLALTADFDLYTTQFAVASPFRRTGQLDHHRVTISLRRNLGSANAALDDDEFLDSLYATLNAWGIGKRASVLVDREHFATSLREHRVEITSFDAVSIDDLNLDLEDTAERLSSLIEHLGVVDNRSTIVAGTKTLHHLLPDLVPPMDRRWTGLFFQWRPNDPQNAHDQIFKEAFTAMALVARGVDLNAYLDAEWFTSKSKCLDNALIGYCQLEVLDHPIPIGVDDVDSGQPNDINLHEFPEERGFNALTEKILQSTRVSRLVSAVRRPITRLDELIKRYER
jgi:hypothetical protein